jgi:hypothetical protein
MYCTIEKNNYVFVYEDSGRLVRKIGVNGQVESAYMNGTDKVSITYTANSNVNPPLRYVGLWDVSGCLIRRTSCR